MILLYTKSARKKATNVVADMFKCSKKRMGGPTTVFFPLFFTFFCPNMKFLFSTKKNIVFKKAEAFLFSAKDKKHPLRILKWITQTSLAVYFLIFRLFHIPVLH